MRLKMLLSIIAAFVLIVTANSCLDSKNQKTEPDYWPTAVWRSSSPEAQGMDSEILLQILDKIRTENLPIDSIHLVRNGYMVLDTCLYPYRQEDLHVINSCTKSIISILTGIAIDQAKIKNMDTPIFHFFQIV